MYNLLIITPQEFAKAVEPLEAFKTLTGIRTKIMILEDIYNKYSGRDEAEKVKRCLAEYKINNNIKYAILVGDSEKFPVRYTKTDRKTPEAKDTAFYGTDLYYADLFKKDGSFDDWDRNQNGYYGELRGESTIGSLNMDEVDLSPDIAVGRIPASTTCEVSNYVAKVIRYELGDHSYWSKRALLIASTDWVNHACKTHEYIEHNYLNNLTVWKLYGKNNPCQVTDIPNPKHINNYWNEGVGFVSYIGHGYVTGWHGCYDIKDMSGLIRPYYLPIVFSSACDTSRFATLPPYLGYTDINGIYHKGTNNGEVFSTTPPQPACFQNRYNPESIGEYMTVKYKTGAIAYIGCLTGAQPYSFDLNKFFFEAFHLGYKTLGEMWKYMLEKYYATHIPPLIVNPPDWRKVAEFHQPWKFIVFGDPSLRIGGIENCTRDK